MLYELKQSKTERTIREQAARQGLPLPDSIREAPALHPHLVLFYEAFKDLSSCRSVGMGEGPIPWLAIHEYALRYGITGDMFERLASLVRIMDFRYLEYRGKELEKKTKPTGKAGKPGRKTPRRTRR